MLHCYAMHTSADIRCSSEVTTGGRVCARHCSCAKEFVGDTIKGALRQYMAQNDLVVIDKRLYV